MKQKFMGFTLSEVLITLGIIGVVAAITLPVVINKIDNLKYKSAYKKAYSDLSQILQKALVEEEWPYRESVYDQQATKNEYEIMKKGFKIIKECDNTNFNECWADGDKTVNGYPKIGMSLFPFIDSAGRSWVNYYYSENIYFVDLNGLKGPNKWNKDRWCFTFVDKNGRRAYTGYPIKVGLFWYYDEDLLYK